jgi:hypothetical protein
MESHMAAKKTYFYDYNNTIPVVNEGNAPAPKVQPYQASNKVTAPQPIATPKIETPQPKREFNQAKGPTFSPPPVREQAPIARPNVLPTMLIIILVVAIGYLAYSLLPQNYSSCSTFPGSKLTSDYPGTCTTFYGKAFTQTAGLAELPVSGDLEMTDQDNNFPLPEFPSPTPRLAGAESEDGPTPADSLEATTKGGLPLEDSTATVKPTAVPTKVATTSGTDSGIVNFPQDWIKHKYPTQKIAFWLPPRFTSTNVTRNTTTSIQTFTLYDGSNAVVKTTLYPNWAGLTDIRDQAVTFMITDNTGVIKRSEGSTYTYYFEKFSQVYSFACTIDSGTCDQIIKSLSFI